MLRKLTLALFAPLLVVACASEAGEDAVETEDTVVDLTEPERPDGAGGGAGLAALRAAPDAIAEVGSGRFEMTFEFDTPEGVFDMLATGGFDGDRMTMEMDFGAMFQQLAESAGESLPPGFEEPMQMVVDGDTFYMRMPMLDMITGTSGWLSGRPEDLGQSGDALGLSGTSTSPTAMLETLRGVSDDVEEVGTEEVRGVETTHYRATIDLDVVLQQVPDAQRAEVEAALEQLSAAGSGTMPVEVWVDGDGLARRMVVALEQIPGMGASGSMRMTMEMFDYGEPVDVQIPDPSEVTPITEAMPGMGTALG